LDSHLQYIYIRLIAVSNTVQTDIYKADRSIKYCTDCYTYIKYAVDRRDYRSCIGLCKVVARDREQYSGKKKGCNNGSGAGCMDRHARHEIDLIIYRTDVRANRK
jgi:hypothetical protein